MRKVFKYIQSLEFFFPQKKNAARRQRSSLSKDIDHAVY
jgi:hypothetical protein